MGFAMTAHQVKVYTVLVDGGGDWQDPKVVEANTGVCLRTCHRHLESFVALGIAEKRSIFPKHYYRLVDNGDLTDGQVTLVEKLDSAAKIIGIT